MKIKRIGVDLAKNVYQLHGVDGHDKCVLQRRLKRDNWLKVLFEKTEPGYEIGMETVQGSFVRIAKIVVHPQLSLLAFK